MPISAYIIAIKYETSGFCLVLSRQQVYKSPNAVLRSPVAKWSSPRTKYSEGLFSIGAYTLFIVLIALYKYYLRLYFISLGMNFIKKQISVTAL